MQSVLAAVLARAMDEEKLLLKTKNYAYRLLSYRQRSTKEIKERLEKKGFNPQTIKKTIAYLTELDYLNDEKFAKVWVQTKLQSSPVGWSLLRYQLRAKGIAEELSEKVLNEYSSYSEIDAAKKLASARRQRYLTLEPCKAKVRLYNYLRRRGFSPETISQVL